MICSCQAWLSPSQTASLSSFCLMTNLHSAAFGEFLPGCLGLLCFLLSPPLTQSQRITRRAVIFPASGMSEKLRFHTFRGSVGWGRWIAWPCFLPACASRRLNVKHLFLFSFRPLLWYATSLVKPWKIQMPGNGDRSLWFWGSGSYRCLVWPFYASEASMWALLQQSRPE